VDRKALNGGSGLSPAAGAGLQATVDIRSLPEIDRTDFPLLPDDMEMRFFPAGDPPCVVLYHPGRTLYIEMPLTDLDNMGKYVAKLRTALDGIKLS
jgi:hypothetical protein